MANLKDLRLRIQSVTSTQKITKAMQMVAAAKLRKAQDRSAAAGPYGQRLHAMVKRLAAKVSVPESAPKLLVGNGNDQVHLLVVITSDRGLCGGFNSSIVRNVRERIKDLHAKSKVVKLLMIGSKGYDQMKGQHGDLIIDSVQGLSKKEITHEDVTAIAKRIEEWVESGEVGVVTLVYNSFVSVITQTLVTKQLVPLEIEEETGAPDRSVMEYEPGEEAILASLIPRNLTEQLFVSLLESFAGEQGARMTAMDSATRNAGDMIKHLTLLYNRTRQAVITRELIEIISGAEAL
jgi:F-type H+-transporting ATPase subunit gamma